jgi:hypothetical protein
VIIHDAEKPPADPSDGVKKLDIADVALDAVRLRQRQSNLFPRNASLRHPPPRVTREREFSPFSHLT